MSRIKSFSFLFGAISVLGSFAHSATILSNVSGTVWAGGNVFNTNWGSAGEKIRVNITVTTGYVLSFDSLDIYLGNSGGNNVSNSVFVQVLNQSSTVLAQSQTVTLTSPENGFYGINNLASAAPYLVSFNLPSLLNLNPGNYALSIRNDGNQLNFMNSTAISAPGVSLARQGSATQAPAMSLGNAAVVPEPSAGVLLMVGAGGIFALRRLRRKAD